MLGKKAKTLQANVLVADGRITGTLKHVTDYTGFSADDPEGHFLALKFDAADGATVKAGLVPSQGTGLVTLDSDMNGVWKVTDAVTQKFKVIVTNSDGKATSKLYDLSGLELQ